MMAVRVERREEEENKQLNEIFNSSVAVCVMCVCMFCVVFDGFINKMQYKYTNIW